MTGRTRVLCLVDGPAASALPVPGAGTAAQAMLGWPAPPDATHRPVADGSERLRARLLLAAVLELGGHGRLDPRDVVLGSGGRPGLRSGEVSVSLSHTADVVAAACAPAPVRVGVDVARWPAHGGGGARDLLVDVLGGHAVPAEGDVVGLAASWSYVESVVKLRGARLLDLWTASSPRRAWADLRAGAVVQRGPVAPAVVLAVATDRRASVRVRRVPRASVARSALRPAA